jgi:hypothetical protein
MVGIVIRLQARQSGFESQTNRFFSSPKSSQPLGPTQPPIQWVQGVLPLGGRGGSLKHLQSEADHSPPSNADMENDWSCTSTCPVCLHCMYKVNLTSWSISLTIYHI